MKKLLLTTAFTLFYLFSIAQNLPVVDYKRYHFGFTLGLNTMDFGIKNSLMPIDGKIYQAEVSTIMPG